MSTTQKKTTYRLIAAVAVALTAWAGQVQADEYDRGYVDLSVGNSRTDTDCGNNPLYGCDKTGSSASVRFGKYFTPNLGGEIGYTDAGKFSRAGGDTRARAANLSVVGRLPMGPLGLFGKAGAAYSRTSTSTGPLSGVAAGDASGWAPTVGVGASWDLLPHVALVGQWERTRMHFAGDTKENVDNTSLGVRVRY